MKLKTALYSAAILWAATFVQGCGSSDTPALPAAQTSNSVSPVITPQFSPSSLAGTWISDCETTENQYQKIEVIFSDVQTDAGSPATAHVRIIYLFTNAADCKSSGFAVAQAEGTVVLSPRNDNSGEADADMTVSGFFTADSVTTRKISDIVALAEGKLYFGAQNLLMPDSPGGSRPQDLFLSRPFHFRGN